MSNVKKKEMEKREIYRRKTTDYPEIQTEMLEHHRRFLRDVLVTWREKGKLLTATDKPWFTRLYRFTDSTMIDIYFSKYMVYEVWFNRDGEVDMVRDLNDINYDYDIDGHTHVLDGLVEEAGYRLSKEWVENAEREVIYGE